jgi:type I restriction-modification system DNA methylase subunit
VEPSPQARKILSELNYDFHAFTIDHFVDWIENARQRKIILIPWTMPSGMFGAWMTDGDEPREYIFYRNDVTRLHQIHIQLHELSHFLFGHPTKQITRENLQESKAGTRELPFTDLVKLRSPEENDYEIEAESLASLIQEQVIRHSQIQQLTRGISSDEKIAEYLKDLGLI